MKMFSDCSGPCCTCACSGHCLAGHGDDDYSPASAEQIINRLASEKWSKEDRDTMTVFLQSTCGIRLKLKSNEQPQMFYFKFTTKDGKELYGSVTLHRGAVNITKLKELVHAEAFQEVTKEEYDAQDEG